MRGGKENADRSKEVWPRTECILFFQVIPCFKMLYELNPNKQKKRGVPAPPCAQVATQLLDRTDGWREMIILVSLVLAIYRLCAPGFVGCARLDF